MDELVEAGPSQDATAKAKQVTKSFREYLDTHKDEIAALEFFYSVPHRRRLTYDEIEELAAEIKAPPRSWTPETLWRAYETLEKDRVKGRSGKRLVTDIVSLVRFALEQDQELRPFEDQVRLNFDRWLSQQGQAGREFTEEQRHWLEMIRDHVATSIEMTMDDFDLAPFAEEGGLGRAGIVFGQELRTLLRDLNEALAA